MKKAFTLVELLAVIILLGLIGLIIYPTVNGVINANKQKLHDKQIEELIRRANTYSTENINKLKTIDGAKNIVTFTDLYNAGLIQNDKVIDPKTDQELAGCLSLIWKDSINGFDITYTDNCINNFSLSGNITPISPINENDSEGITFNPIKVELIQNNTVIYETTADNNNHYEFVNIEGGKYLLLITPLYKTRYGIEIMIDNDITKDIAAKFYIGDFNNDSLINQLDINILTGDCYNSNTINKPECIKYNINNAGIVGGPNFR